MFKKYNINELFIAQIEATYHYNEMLKDNNSIFLLDGMSYSYITIVRKHNERYCDLQNLSLPIDIEYNEKNNSIFSYQIKYLEPLNNYYTQDGKIKISKKKSYKIVKNNNQKIIKKIKELNNKK